MQDSEKRLLYFDGTASLPVTPEIAATYSRNLIKYYANPAAVYRAGLEAKQLIKNATQELADYFQIKTTQLVFTSGATESINTAFYNIALRKKQADVVLMAAGEHSADVACAERLAAQKDCILEILPLAADYRVDLQYLDNILAAYKDRILALSHVYVSNETGVINDLASIDAMLRKHARQAVWHLDAVQAWGKVDCDLSELSVDFVSFAGHKIGAPKGSGLLYVREPQLFQALIVGGRQQGNLRSGTENAPLVAALAQAQQLHCSIADLQEHNNKLWLLRSTLKNALADLQVEYQEAEKAWQYPGIISLTFPKIRGEILLHALERYGIMVATSSSCHNLAKHKTSDSNMQLFTPAQATGHLRITLTPDMTLEDVTYLADNIHRCYDEIQK